MALQSRSFNLLPEVIKNLMIINGLFFVATLVFNSTFGIDLAEYLGLFLPASPLFQPYQIITHMFMHGGLMHIFSNMFALWLFGMALENVWGPKRFLLYYLVTGLGAALLHLGVLYWEYFSLINQMTPAGIADVKTFGAELLNSNRNYLDANQSALNLLLNMPTVGASGAVFGVLLAFGMMFPNQYIYIYLLFPIRAKYFVAIYGIFELYNGFSNQGSNIAHFAHLGGMLFGFFLIQHWRRNRQI